MSRFVLGAKSGGYPKKLGRLTLDTTDDVVRATVEHGGITVIDAAIINERRGKPCCREYFTLTSL